LIDINFAQVNFIFLMRINQRPPRTAPAMPPAPHAVHAS